MPREEIVGHMCSFFRSWFPLSTLQRSGGVGAQRHFKSFESGLLINHDLSAYCRQ
jgi:hypothetical protein